MCDCGSACAALSPPCTHKVPSSPGEFGKLCPSAPRIIKFFLKESGNRWGQQQWNFPDCTTAEKKGFSPHISEGCKTGSGLQSHWWAEAQGGLQRGLWPRHTLKRAVQLPGAWENPLFLGSGAILEMLPLFLLSHHRPAYPHNGWVVPQSLCKGIWFAVSVGGRMDMLIFEFLLCTFLNVFGGRWQKGNINILK